MSDVNISKLRNIFFCIFILFSVGTRAQPQSNSFSSDYLLLQGKITAWLIANTAAQMGSANQKFKTFVLVLSSLVIPMTEQISWQSLLAYFFGIDLKASENSVQDDFFQHVSLISPEQAEPYASLIFNNVTQRETDAVVYRALSLAKNHEKQSTLMLYGDPGSGKTAMAKSFARWPQFRVHMIASKALGNVENFREVFKLCQGQNRLIRKGYFDIAREWVSDFFVEPQSEEEKNKVNVIVVDDAEFFMRALRPGSKHGHSNDQERLESEFRTALGSDYAECLWIFTSNKAAEFEGDADRALERRYKNPICVRLPDEETMIRMLQTFVQRSIHHRQNLFGDFIDSIKIDENTFDGDNRTALIQKANGTSPDTLRQVADNAVQDALNQAIGTKSLDEFFAGQPSCSGTGEEKVVYVGVQHLLFFLNANIEREAWLVAKAEREFKEKQRLLERQVVIRELEKRLEGPKDSK